MGLNIPDDFNDDDTLARIHSKLEHLAHLYASGKPLFPRRVLADLDSQIDQGNEEVHITDLDDVRHTYSLKAPAWCADFATTYRIGYSSIQNLTCIHPSFPEISLRDSSPISICYTSSADFPKCPLEEVQRAFHRSLRIWEDSETCATLRAHLAQMKFSRPIRKIIAFGLGTLTALEDEYHAARSHAQHAAVRTMADALMKRQHQRQRHHHHQPPGDLRADSIKCYAQDPAYTDIDTDILRSIGITPLDDPKGFLGIDADTLVFSVSPNVPVKQVVADVCWPAAMIWNTVTPEEREEEKRWEKQVRNGEEFWVVPFTTDPDSQRVRRMVQAYSSVALRDSNEYFGDLTIYVR
ncbi:SRR1 family protein [Aspergillus lucknowensis]|uniref:SRR1-like domain-containing protein n=1 Tax=Aspergillus lucknowensis TaxID=176173 RepID=A0ABR4LJ06_9EURO